MICLSTEQVLLLHRITAEASGGSAGVRDGGLLDSALNAPFQTFGGQELYPSLVGKAARLGYSLIANHPFVDGNKRIGVGVADGSLSTGFVSSGRYGVWGGIL
ncbi:MAG: Fic family protein [Candidatus Accumulibacter sp.]|jgi:death-on-curing protein|nr:Fic family protein [Accumulibacter sp.]